MKGVRVYVTDGKGLTLGDVLVPGPVTVETLKEKVSQFSVQSGDDDFVIVWKDGDDLLEMKEDIIPELQDGDEIVLFERAKWSDTRGRERMRSSAMEVRGLEQLRMLGVYEFSMITCLTLSECLLSSFPTELGLCNHLEELDLSFNQLQLLPAEVSGWTRLQILSLRSNQLVSLPPEVCSWSSLKKLHLGYNQLAALPVEVGGWAAVRELYLGRNKLQSLPLQVEMWTALQTLYLHNNELAVLPVEVRCWTALQTLSAFGNELVEFPGEVGHWTGLRDLYLHNNQLRSLPAQVGQWTAVHTLSFFGNGLESFPSEVENWTNLRELYIYGNKLRSLPVGVQHWASVQKLHVSDNPIFPAELTALSAQEIVSFYRRLTAGEPVQSFVQRIMLVGKSGKGKTSLRMRLTDGMPAPVLGPDERTYGIDIHEWTSSDVFIERGGEKHKIHVEFWDFAGQPQFFPTHQMLLRSHALYWIIFSWVDELEATIGDVLEQFGYIRASSKDSPVMLVGTHCDELDVLVVEAKWAELTAGLKLTALNFDERVFDNKGNHVFPMVVGSRAKDFRESGIGSLLEAVNVVLESQSHLGLLIPEQDAAVEKAVLAHRRSIVTIDSSHAPKFLFRKGFAAEQRNDFKSAPVLSVEDFCSTFCKGLNAKDADAMLSLLSLRGIVWYRKGARDVFLDPQWVTRDIIGDIADDKRNAGLVGTNGVTPLLRLVMHWHHLLPDVQKKIPGVLESLGLAFPMGRDEWIIPLLARDWSSDDGVFPASVADFAVHLSVPVPKVFAMLQFRWLSLQATLEYIRIRKNKVQMRVGDDECWVALSENGFDVCFWKARGSDWLVAVLISTMEELFAERFEGVRLGVLGGVVPLHSVRHAWLEKRMIVLGLRDVDPSLLLPFPESYWTGVAVDPQFVSGAPQEAWLICRELFRGGCGIGRSCLESSIAIVLEKRRKGFRLFSDDKREIGVPGVEIDFEVVGQCIAWDLNGQKKTIERASDAFMHMAAAIFQIACPNCPLTGRRPSLQAPPPSPFKHVLKDSKLPKERRFCDEKDKNLWNFAFGLAVDVDDLRKLDDCWEECKLKLQQALMAECQHNEMLRHLQADARIAGSLANRTNVAWSDMDQIVVLNENALVQEREGVTFWMATGVPVSVAIDDLRSCIVNAVGSVENLATLREWPFRLLLARFHGKLSCTFGWGPYEWDVLFALRNNMGENLMLETLKASDNGAATVRIERFSRDFVGLREMIRCAKVLGSDWNEKHTSRDGLKGSLFETIVLETADSKGMQWWNKGPDLRVGEHGTRFAHIVFACFSHLKDCLLQNKKVSPQNDSSVDLLGKRHDKALVTELSQWIDVLLKVCRDDIELLKWLKRLSGIEE